MKRIAIILLLVGIGLLLILLLPKPPETSHGDSTGTPSKPQQYRMQQLPKLSNHYQFETITKHLNDNRAELTSCVLMNTTADANRVTLTFHWSSSGRLSSVVLKPDFGDATRTCITKLVAKWRLDGHHGMQPFSYTTTLIVGGGTVND